jgi:hypothetical protein
MQLTEDTIQRLVDGELDAAEYQDALLALEADPTTCESNAWRRCALTFLESQAFEFGAKSWLEARKRGESGSELNDAETTLVAPIAQPARKFPAWLTLLSVAASLAIAFWIGGQMSELSRPKLPPFHNIEETSDGSIFVSVSVDDEGAFDREAWLAGAPSPLPLEIQKRWEQEGFGVRARRRLIPMTVPDGRTIPLPFETYEKVPRTSALQ